MNIDQFERLNLGFLPTPLTPLPRLSAHLGGPNLYIKRDDCTGLAGGGNKVRKLEYLLADALKNGADTVITQGAVQSNHARQTAAACASLGLACHLLLEDRTSETQTQFYANGNVLLDQIFGAQVEIYPGGTDMNQQMSLKAHTLTELGHSPYVIPGGGSNHIGGLGYVRAAKEIFQGASDLAISLDHIIHATGSCGTQAGLVAGLACLGKTTAITGISVRFSQTIQQQKVHTLSKQILDYMEVSLDLPLDVVRVDDRFIGQGYGIPTPGTLDAIKLFARFEGILLDPVYTGKGAAGLIQMVQERQFSKNENIVFLHTGGAQSLPGFGHYFDFPAVNRVKT